jgi:hypothetical protein
MYKYYYIYIKQTNCKYKYYIYITNKFYVLIVDNGCMFLESVYSIVNFMLISAFFIFNYILIIINYILFNQQLIN